MAGYLKMWTTIKSNPKFLSLRGNARSVFLQLMITAKEQRDDGTVAYRNVAALSQDCGYDARSCSKLVAELQQKRLLTYTQNSDGTVVVVFPNYKKWQELGVAELLQGRYKNAAKIPSLRPDQTKADHICQNEKKEGEIDAQELVNLFNKMLAPPLDKVKILRPQSKRLKTILTRLKEHPEVTFWVHIYKTVSESNWLCGRKGGWKADFNWLLNPNRLEEIYEGKYDNNPIMTPQEEANHYKNKKRSN